MQRVTIPGFIAAEKLTFLMSFLLELKQNFDKVNKE